MNRLEFVFHCQGCLRMKPQDVKSFSFSLILIRRKSTVISSTFLQFKEGIFELFCLYRGVKYLQVLFVIFNVLLSNEIPGPSCSQPDSSKPETSRLKGRSQIVVYAFSLRILQRYHGPSLVENVNPQR